MIDNEVALNGLIVDLKSVIDQLNFDFIQAKRLIQELARILDEPGKLEKSEISAKIKEILADKIKEHKITEKWIEECLPSEYKRKYTRKSEQSSLSKKIENVNTQRGNIIDNGDGSALLINHNTGQSDSPNNIENITTDITSSRGSERQEYETSVDSTDTYQILQEEIRQLKEALSKQTKMMIGDQIQSTEMEFKIARERYYKIREAMSKSKYFTYITFDNMGFMLRVTADIFKTL